MIEAHLPEYLKDAIGKLNAGGSPTPAQVTKFNGLMWRFLTELPDVTKPVPVDVPELPVSPEVIEMLLRDPVPQIIIYRPAITDPNLQALIARLAYGERLSYSRAYGPIQDQDPSSKGRWLSVDAGAVPPYRNLTEDQQRFMITRQTRVGISSLAYIIASRFHQYATTRFVDGVVHPGKPFDILTDDPNSHTDRQRAFRSRLLGSTFDKIVVTGLCTERDHITFSTNWDATDKNQSLGARSMTPLGWG